VPVYHSGTADIGAAKPLTLAAGQEIGGKDFILKPTRGVRISGNVLGSNGSPRVNGDVALLQHAGGRYDRPAWGLDSARIAPDGSFTIAGVAPGQYLIQVQTVDVTGRRGASRGSFQEIRGYEYALMPLTVKDANVEGIRVVTSTGATATGRIVFDEGAQPRFGPNSLPLTAPPVGVPLSRMNWQSTRARVRTDWTFEVTGLFGPRVFRVAELPGWTVKAVRRDGADITDTPIEFKGGEAIAGIEVVMSTRITEVTGSVSDGPGRPVTDFAVVVFAEDASRWRAVPLPMQPGSGSRAGTLSPFGAASRFVRIGRPDQHGWFRIPGLPAGRYLAVAVESIGEGEWNDPAVLEAFRPHGTVLALAEGERKNIDLPLTRIGG
jgi:hypothetical protein